MADNELALINKVELRIALTADDRQFESSINLYLAPLLLKLSSPHAEVRKAVLKIIQYLIPRIAAAREIKLPIEALLDQVKHPKVPANTDPSSVILYSLLFVSRGVDRLSDEEKRLLVPKVIENISEYPSNVSARLFNILCKLLTSWKAPERGSPEFDATNKFLQLENNPNDEKFISTCIAKFFMLQPNPTSTPIQMPGLSVSDCAFFTRDAGVVYKTQQEILEVKKHLLEFLKAGFKDSNLVIPLLIASVDSSASVNDTSDLLFRKLNLDLESPELVNDFVALFVGSKDIPPCKPTLQEQILSLLIKSKAVTRNPQISVISNIGLSSDYSKLKKTTIQFIKWVSNVDNEFNESENKSLKEFNINMVAQLKNNLLSEGWPQIDSSIKNYSSSISQRLLQYETLGNIIRSTPELIVKDFSYIEFLFQSLEGENPELRTVIQNALSSLTVHLPNLSIESKERLKELAKAYLSFDKDLNNENLHSCRYVSIKYINCAFSFNDPEARYLCILGTSKDNRSETIEEASKGLHPYWFNILQSSNTLEFKSTSELLGEGSTVEFPLFQDVVLILITEIHKVRNMQGAIIFKALGQAIQFTLQTLVMQAITGKNTVVVPDVEWTIRLDKALEVDKTVQDLLINEIKKISYEDKTNLKENPFNSYLSIIFETFIGQYYDHNAIIQDITYSSTFTKLIALSPSKVVSKLSPMVSKLLDLLDSKLLNDVSTIQVCKLIGIIASHPINNNSAVQELLSKLILFDNIPTYLLKSRLLASGYLVSRLVLRKRNDVIYSELLKDYCEMLLKSFNDSNLYNIVLECISQLSVFGALGPVINSHLKLYVLKFIEIIKPKVKKCDEKSVLTLSYLSLAIKGKSQDDEIGSLEQLVYETHVSKQIEYTFTSGEAFSVISSGWDSTFLQRQIDVQGESIEYIPKDISRLSAILNLILKSCANTKPSLRKSGCIWLLSLVQYCGHLQQIKDRAPEIHVSFMKFLADRDELVQESASRGLSIVYEIGSYELKDTLVRGLLKSFTDSGSTSSFTSGVVENDTELFEPDLLKTNDGSVSTYKDVLNLASDVGDPSLVYKFMSLAKSSALWSSRKGMAFGLGSILSKSSLDMLLSSNKHLSNRLIPKLFRYRYDPNTSVSKSMNDIWNSLIKDTSKTVKDNFSIILPELLKSMGDKEWRVRQAGANALNDLLLFVPLETYEPELEKIWNMSFRVMDDIKESVRKEGNKLTKNLATTLIRMIDVKYGVSKSQSTKILNDLFPFLLGNKGLLNDSEDVRNFALDTILKLCKIGGESIKPFIPILIDKFIGLMSTLEPGIINYLILNADKYNIKNSEIDAKRLQSLGSSPMMEAVEQLLDILDDSIMDEFIIRLQSSIKKSVGLPSKVCGSRVLVSLTTKHFQLIKPYGDKLLKFCVLQINDKNDTISSSYSTAAGYLCRISSIQSIINYSEVINKLYFEGEDERSREIAAIASESVSKYSGEKFESVAGAFLPLSFIGKHDINKLVKSTFEREWIENTSGNTSSIKLYFVEILKFCESYLTSNRFEIRQILGKSISDLCNLIDDISGFSNDINKLIDLLIEACKGKSWSGKELILDSLISLSIKSKEFLNGNNELLLKVNKVVLTESKRKNKNYQKHSIKLLGKFISNFPNDELIECYTDIMHTILSDQYYEDDSDNDNMDIDGNYQKISNKLMVKLEEERLDIISNLIETFFVDSGKRYDSRLLYLTLVKTFESLTSKIIEVSWRSKAKISEYLSDLIKKLDLTTVINEEEVNLLFKNWKQLRKMCLDSNSIESVKINFIRFSHSLINFLLNLNALDKVQIIKESLQNYQKCELSSIVQTELLKVLQ